MNTSSPAHNKGNRRSNIVDIVSGKTFSSLDNERLIRLSPEYEGLCMLYSTHDSPPDRFFTMRILCWAIRNSGEVVALVPWLNKILPCTMLAPPFHGQFEGYFDPQTEEVFSEPPPHKVTELETAVYYYDCSNKYSGDQAAQRQLQEIPDTIGTHAMLTAEDSHSLILTEVISWRLMGDGHLQAMLIDDDLIDETPVLPGDPCLYPAETSSHFRYYFQHQVANQIKAEDPDAMAAVAMLFDN